MNGVETIDQLHGTWGRERTPESMHKLLTALDPFIRSQVYHLTGSLNPAIRMQAKAMAATAVRSYDPAHGVKLTTYLGYQLKPLKRVAIKYDKDFKVPEKVLQDWYVINNATQEFSNKHNREPSVDELADHLSMPVKRIQHVRQSARGAMSEGQLPEGMPLGSQGISNLSTAAEYVHKSLPPEDQRLFEMRTGYGGEGPHSVEEIGARLNMHPSAVSQRSAEIAKKIRDTETLF
jgi:DNA-directed RNA polymerase specialized sigma subunit